LRFRVKSLLTTATPYIPHFRARVSQHPALRSRDGKNVLIVSIASLVYSLRGE